jgi:hypothetical protein
VQVIDNNIGGGIRSLSAGWPDDLMLSQSFPPQLELPLDWHGGGQSDNADARETHYRSVDQDDLNV